MKPSDGAAGDWFGYYLDLEGDVAIVGSRYADGISVDSGAAYLFRRNSSGTWNELAKITPIDGAAGDEFGHSVSLDGNIIAIAAPLDDDNGTDSGSVYIFRITN